MDEIELASITFNDQAEFPHGPASAIAAGETGIQKGDAEASLNISSTLDLFAIASHNTEDIVDLSHRLHPPRRFQRRAPCALIRIFIHLRRTVDRYLYHCLSRGRTWHVRCTFMGIHNRF
ncbi:hypothetical protein BU15DRAFT_75170 [Melanogaster broomeanus]|nr:hypothetical protein BU15DRAFT_75170 [Melanogaster broomeanus]